MQDNPEFTKKVKDFLTDVCDFAQGELPFSSIDNYVNQVVVYYTIDHLDTQINTLKSIKHLLNDSQLKDINTMIEKYTAMKAKLYERL